MALKGIFELDLTVTEIVDLIAEARSDGHSAILSSRSGMPFTFLPKFFEDGMWHGELANGEHAKVTVSDRTINVY